MRRTLYRWLVFAACGIAGLALLPGLPGGVARAAAPVVEEALNSYNEARFTDAIQSLRAALAGGQLAERDALEAKALLGRCLVKAGERLEAKEAFKSLLRQSPGYRLDPQAVPPDEVEVFALAHRELTSEQIEAGSRVPASISFATGWGSRANKDMGKVVHATGGEETFDPKASFGGSVRFPLKPRLSLEIEIQRLRATASDSFPENVGGRYEATALPLSVSCYYAAIARTSWRLNVFGGLGPLLAATSTLRANLGADRVAISDERVGFYGHVGAEGEYLIHPRFSVTGRLLGRIASASGMHKDTDPDFRPWGTLPITDRKLDFSGVGAQVGARAYIGY